MSKTAEKFYKTLKNKVLEVSVIKGFSDEEQQKILTSARKNIITAINQKTAVLQMLRNVNKNRATARDLRDLVFAIKGPLPDPTGTDLEMELDVEEGEPSTKHKKDKGKLENPPVPSDYAMSYVSVPTEARDDMNIVQEEVNEPKISQSQLDHINKVVKILEKHPGLKNDIRRTITEELTKGYINPEQFKEYNQAIEYAKAKDEAKEAPPAVRANKAVRAKKAPKPRAKKSLQADVAMLPVDTSPKLPKGKDIKNNQKKKTKNCYTINNYFW